MNAIPIILVGGFLGAGKTTLLRDAARRLAAQGRRVGLITNDQAADLVDTRLLAGQGLDVREVSGSCFCCNFPALIQSAQLLQAEHGADILIAEPVGSCTDLSATIMQPLKDRYADQFAPAPLSVLVDPQRLREVLTDQPGRLHTSAAYILRKQLEEADIIVLNKIDLLDEAQVRELRGLVATAFPGKPLRGLSALTGQGVDEWLAEVLASSPAGRQVVEVDYDTYAEGEAVLGWLNAAIGLSATGPADWQAFARDLLADVQWAVRYRNAEVGHVKLLLSAGAEQLAANLTRTDGDIDLRGGLAPSAAQADLTFNARVAMSPADLETLVRDHLARAAARHRLTVTVNHLRSLSPGRPNPTYRYERVVDG